MIRLPGYAAVLDKDDVEKARANIREAGVEDSVEVEENRIVVIGCDEVSRRYLVVMADGHSVFVSMGRVWFDLRGPKTRRALVEVKG